MRVKVQKHGGRAHPDGSSGFGWSSKYGKYEGWNDWMVESRWIGIETDLAHSV